jgi:hypothetical protein
MNETSILDQHPKGWALHTKHGKHVHFIPENQKKSICGHYEIFDFEMKIVKFVTTTEVRENKKCKRCIFIMKTMPKRNLKTEIERFKEKITIDNNGCWNWTAAKNMGGYGQFKFNRKMIYAHRFSYAFHKGSIPKDLTLDHLCRNRACVNPEHLEPVIQKENILRGQGLCAINARKTHCPKGHPLSGSNLYINPNGGRQCKICRKCERVAKQHRIELT